MTRWAVALLLLAGCGSAVAPTVERPAPAESATEPVQDPPQEATDLQELADILAAMLAHGNASQASLRVSSEQQAHPDCQLTGISGYFSHPDKIEAMTDEYVTDWLKTHPHGEAAHAVADMEVDQQVSGPDGLSLAKAVAVLVLRDCSG